MKHFINGCPIEATGPNGTLSSDDWQRARDVRLSSYQVLELPDGSYRLIGPGIEVSVPPFDLSSAPPKHHRDP